LEAVLERLDERAAAWRGAKAEAPTARRETIPTANFIFKILMMYKYKNGNGRWVSSLVGSLGYRIEEPSKLKCLAPKRRQSSGGGIFLGSFHFSPSTCLGFL
jgi:hypothetical protein